MTATWGPEEHRAGLASAGALFHHLVTGGDLQPLPFTTLRLGPDEHVYADCPLEYSRFYGMNVQHQQQSVVAVGSLSFMLGAYAANAAGNAAARRRAEAMSRPQWRDIMITRVVLTSRRFLVSIQGQWLSFWANAVVEFLPDPGAFTLITSYGNGEPLRLRGPAVPWISVAFGRLLYEPEQLARIPAFAGFAATSGPPPVAGLVPPAGPVPAAGETPQLPPGQLDQ
jgi:hypothetical protein